MKPKLAASVAALLLLAALGVPAARSHPHSGPRVVRGRRSKTPLYVTGLHAKPIGGGAVQAALRHLRRHETLYHIPVETTLRPAGKDRIHKLVSVRFDQTLRGVPVFGAQYVVHMKKTADGFAPRSANGHYFTDLDAPVESRVSEADARLVARAAARPVVATRVRSHGLTVLPAGKGVLTYHFTVRGSEFASPARREVFVNARTGAPALSYDNLQGATAVTGSGTRANGDHVALEEVRRRAGRFELRDRSRAMYASDGGEISTHDVAGMRSYFATDANVVRSSSPDFPDSATQSGAVDAHWGAGQVYEFYRALGRNSIDDAGMSIVSSVDASEGGQPLFNAFWDGHQMVYGNPDPAQLFPLSAGLDVVGHELTHGVTQHSARLVYMDQSGAMNEGYSDYFGNAIDDTVNPSKMDDPQTNGYMGEDLCRVSNPTDGWTCPTRDLNDGSTVADYVPLLNDLDNGGVHANMTIYSGALWDIRQALYAARGQAGAHDADRYVYAALTQYDTPLDTFVDGRNAVVTAARALNASDDDVAAIQKAFDDRGIVAGWDNTMANDSDILLANVSPQGFQFYSGPQTSGHEFVIGDFPQGTRLCCEPMQLLLGRDDGSIVPRGIGEAKAPHMFAQETPDISGDHIVWARASFTNRAGFDYDVRSRVLGHGPRTVVHRPGFQWVPAVDGGTVAWESATRAGTDIWARRPGHRPELVAGAKGEQWMPQVHGDWVAWWDVGKHGDKLGIGLKNLETDKHITLAPPSKRSVVGPPALGPGYVAWYEDDDGDGTGSIMTAPLGSTKARPVVKESSANAPQWHQVSAPPLPSGNAGYLTYSDERSFATGANGGSTAGAGRDIWIVPLRGGRPRLVTANAGDQAYPQMASGRTVVFLDSSQGHTDLLSRRVPR